MAVEMQLQDWLWPAGLMAGAVLLSFVVYWVLFAIAAKLAARTTTVLDQSLVRQSAGPVRWIFPTLALTATVSSLPLGKDVIGSIRHVLSVLLIILIAWLAIRMLDVLQDVLAARYRLDVSDNLTARRINTQVGVLRRLSILVIGAVALAAVLMTFPTIWNLGAGLFASAGVAGLVVGMAARPTLSNLLAGLQIALTEPMRIDDVVIVEGEWGWIEEIETTYVVVRIWDLRRLIVPLSYFIEKPFQNWTRKSTDLLASVYLYTDYTVPVEEVRQELHRVLESSGMWDGKVWVLQVTNATEHTIEMRALMSAPDAGKAWDLRCHVREKLVAFLQRNYPESLPRTRAIVERTEPPSAIGRTD
jgi:small-conductance mechanosensitive channel